MLADCVVLDAHGSHHRLGDIWSERPALLLFVRHFACIGCAAQVDVLAPRLPELSSLDVNVAIIGNGTPNFIAGFVARQGLEGRAVIIYTDPTRAAFRAAGMIRSVWGSAGPIALFKLLRARLDGHRGGSRIEGDAWQQGGALLVGRDGAVVLAHRNRDLGDHVDPADLVAAALTLKTRREAAWTL